MPTEEQRDEILKAAEEVQRARAAYELALARFDAVLEGRIVEPGNRKPHKRAGKAPNPRSVTQRVVAALTASGGPMKVNSIAEQLKKSPKQVRYAIVYHQRKGRVIRVGEGMYDLKARQNGSGQHAAESN